MTDLSQHRVPPGVKFDQTSRVMGRTEMEEIVKYTRLLQKTLEVQQAAIIELQQKVVALES